MFRKCFSFLVATTLLLSIVFTVSALDELGGGVSIDEDKNKLYFRYEEGKDVEIDFTSGRTRTTQCKNTNEAKVYLIFPTLGREKVEITFRYSWELSNDTVYTVVTPHDTYKLPKNLQNIRLKPPLYIGSYKNSGDIITIHSLEWWSTFHLDTNNIVTIKPFGDEPSDWCKKTAKVGYWDISGGSEAAFKVTTVTEILKGKKNDQGPDSGNGVVSIEGNELRFILIKGKYLYIDYTFPWSQIGDVIYAKYDIRNSDDRHQAITELKLPLRGEKILFISLRALSDTLFHIKVMRDDKIIRDEYTTKNSIELSEIKICSYSNKITNLRWGYSGDWNLPRFIPPCYEDGTTVMCPEGTSVTFNEPFPGDVIFTTWGRIIIAVHKTRGIIGN